MLKDEAKRKKKKREIDNNDEVASGNQDKNQI